jgi:hypothetical protein
MVTKLAVRKETRINTEVDLFISSLFNDASVLKKVLTVDYSLP